MLVSVIHPSRSRPDRSKETVTNWLSKAGCKVEMIVSIDSDDPDMSKYIAQYSSEYAHVIANPNKSAIEAINAGARFATGDILIVASDDTACPDDWALKILELTKGKTDWLLSCQDGIQDHRIITMPCMDRAYYKRFGYIYYPAYEHMGADEELTKVGQILGRIIKCDLSFPHKHYSVTGQERDEVSKKADATLQQGRNLFKKRKRKSFFLSKQDFKYNP